MIKILSVVGARPNFMKIAPLHHELLQHENRIKHLICHTGQHFDEKMSDVFFKELNLPEPEYHLGVGGGSHSIQTARIMIEFEKVLLKEKPDLVIVAGDVNSTLACSITAAKMNVKIAHIEAGLRSFDRTMPEEINRIVTDSITRYHFISEVSGITNLKSEGIKKDHLFYVGNIMIDSLVACLPKIKDSKILKRLIPDHEEGYILVTFHRPGNVDSYNGISSLILLLNNISEKRLVVFPIHPRTKQSLIMYNLLSKLSSRILLTEPLGYLDFISLEKQAELVITDSGGIQEETTWLGVQCITVRSNTERPITVDVGTNWLIGTDLSKVEMTVNKILNGEIKRGEIPDLWDGKTAYRIAQTLLSEL